jgi:uncharacterized RDD family membrane protein YckC
MSHEILDEQFDIANFDYASTGKRFGNYLIDAFIFFLIVFFVVIGLMLTLGEEAIPSFIIDEDFGSQMFSRLFFAVLFGFFMFSQELTFKGRSIGKFITGTKAVNNDGYVPTTKQLLIRNFTRVIPFEAFSFLGSLRGWHDQWSDTSVIKA